MKKVIANIQEEGIVDLTHGKEYELISNGESKSYLSGSYIEVKNDIGQLLKYDSTYFYLKPIETNDLIKKADQVNHPSHYGGKDNPYETIKVIEAWRMNFNLGQVIKYISRAGKKDDIIQDLEKAKFYLEREINNLKNK